MDLINKLTANFLGRLEEKEAKFLTWGYVNGGFSEDEIYDEAEEFLEQEGKDVTPDELVDEMLGRRLLFVLNMGGRLVWRTRMSEAVRLFARLRQIFQGKRWELAPTLVADFRFALRDRKYPKRHIPASNVIEFLSPYLSPPARETLGVLLGRGEFLLSDFQVRATERMLSDLEKSKSRGMIVCAGTGTGKTISFYLPALTHVSTLVERGVFWTKAIAIYPRNELLKDQFSETYHEAKRLENTMSQRVGRKITIGAFFGDTPKWPYESEVKNKWAYDRASGGYVCPYLRCPECEGSLVWLKADLDQHLERLHCCSSNCSCVIGGDEVLLTRRQMAETPPDFLFTTTETLNRQMTDVNFQHVFGINARRRPHLMLLDEVHTYEGVHGAQVSHLLRRWRYAVGAKVHFTGLSATLQDATDFFSQLVGLKPNQVEEISPGEKLISEGKEYNLILRGDPVSATSLLSTTIQASMLLGRILDIRSAPVSQGQYGQRLFIFTDDLDVTNRLYHNLLDAEGLNSQGRPATRKRPLAAIRATTEPDNAQRLLEGQSWYICEEIGHFLDNHRRVGRTSSQDTGVDAASDMVVATSSLEVGFNDPKVGAVLQHKAPRDMASYLQRKGRAGRPRGMRPWTVVVLSDYGRDRLAYQGYETLFDPVLVKRVLPVDNRYVLRMQAVFAFMEWVAGQIPASLPKGSVWVDFSCPSEKFYANHEESQTNMRIRQHYEAELIEEVLKDREKRQSLEEYLQKSLIISEEEVQAVLWSPPRALITAVLPTLLRRLRTNWFKLSRAGEAIYEYFDRLAPLPEFVPANLFSDLNLPEVTITTPPLRDGDNPGQQKMGMIQAMSTFAPGRVTRRFGVHQANLCHWVAPPDLQADEQTIKIEEFCTDYEEIGSFQYVHEGTVKNISCLRPWEYKPVKTPKNVLPTSNAMLMWQSQIIPAERGLEADLPHASPWLKIIQQVQFYMHNQQSAVQVRRFATGSEANLRFERGKEQSTRIYFSRHNEAVSIGFNQAVDGIVFSFQIPPGFSISEGDPNKAKIRSFRSAYFRHRVMEDKRLNILTNVFQRDWLCQVYLSMIITRALLDEISLTEAYEIIRGKDIAQEMEEVLDVIFQTIEVEESNSDTQDERVTEIHRQKVHQVLLELCQNPTITSVLNELAPLLWQEPDDEWNKWAIARFISTLGGALLQACLELLPQCQEGDLYLDIYPGPRQKGAPETLEGCDEIWITEATSGGGGVVEEIFRRYADDPRRFFRLVESVLGPSDFELVDSELTKLLKLTQTDPEISDSLANIRVAEGYEELYNLNRRFRDLLMTRGILVTHPVISAINNRILRPGSSTHSDELLHTILKILHLEEERLGIEIDNRVFAYVFSRKYSDHTMFNQALSHIGSVQCADPHWRFLVVYGLLWPRGNTVRARALQSYNHFAQMPESDREILLDALHSSDVVIPLADPEWRERVTEALSRYGVVRLYAETCRVQELKTVMQDLVVGPVDVGFLHLYPRVEGMQREADGYYVTLDLREAVQ